MGGSYQPVRFRRDAQDNVHIHGTMHTTSTGAAATAWTLPDGYKPAGPQRIPVVIAVSSTITAGMATTTVSITPTPPASADVHFNVFMQ